MSDDRDTHEEAMERADSAIAAQKAGDLEKARALFAEACQLESGAAHMLLDELDAEPTRSVLFRSAASLAVQAQQLAYAAYLVACGMEGSPPQEIREELRDVLCTVRGQLEPERLSGEGLGGDDGIGRHLSSCAHLRDVADRVRTALAGRTLMGRNLSVSVIREILGSTEDSLRAFTGDVSLSVDLLGLGDTDVTEWVSALLVNWDLRWPDLANVLMLDHGDTLRRGGPIVGRIDDLADKMSLSEQCLTLAREADIRALAAHAVRAIDENDADEPAFTLLALASQETAFAGELACQILSETVSLLEIVVQIGWRDDILRLRKGSHTEGS